MVCWIYGLVLSGKRKNMALKDPASRLKITDRAVLHSQISAVTLAYFK